jgi:hypothetical protein
VKPTPPPNGSLLAQVNKFLAEWNQQSPEERAAKDAAYLSEFVQVGGESMHFTTALKRHQENVERVKTAKGGWRVKHLALTTTFARDAYKAGVFKDVPLAAIRKELIEAGVACGLSSKKAKETVGSAWFGKRREQKKKVSEKPVTIPGKEVAETPYEPL